MIYAVDNKMKERLSYVKKNIFALAALVTLAGCADFANQVDRGLMNNSAGDYRIVKYSGGQVVEDYWLHNIRVTQNSHTDGCFFVYKNLIVEVEGDVTVTRFKDGFKGEDRMYIKGLNEALEAEESNNNTTKL